MNYLLQPFYGEFICFLKIFLFNTCCVWAIESVRIGQDFLLSKNKTYTFFILTKTICKIWNQFVSINQGEHFLGTF